MKPAPCLTPIAAEVAHALLHPSPTDYNDPIVSWAPHTPESTTQSWDDLSAMYTTCAKAVMEIGIQIRDLILLPGVLESIQNKDEFEIRIRGLKTDLEQFADQLVAIQKKHCHYAGVVRDENELATSISLFEDYIEWSSQFNGLIETNLVGISQELNCLVQRLPAGATA